MVLADTQSPGAAVRDRAADAVLRRPHRRRVRAPHSVRHRDGLPVQGGDDGLLVGARRRHGACGRGLDLPVPGPPRSRSIAGMVAFYNEQVDLVVDGTRCRGRAPTSCAGSAAAWLACQSGSGCLRSDTGNGHPMRSLPSPRSSCCSPRCSARPPRWPTRVAEEHAPRRGPASPPPPAEVSLTFGEAVRLPASPIRVTGPDSAVWTVGRRRSPAPPSRRPSAATGPAGAYTLTWQVISDDGDTIRGTVRFTLTAPAAARGRPGLAAGLRRGQSRR